MDELIQVQTTKMQKWFKPILFAGMLLFAFYASTHMVAAGDTWVAMACGRHFDNHGVDTVEPFSFNSHSAGPSDEALEKYPEWTRGIIKKWHPTGWINQNWLTHLIFYKLASWFGDDGSYNYNTLVYWKFAIYFLAVICIYATGKLMGAGDFLSAAGACFAMVVGRTYYDIRPSGYSNLLVPVFILLLALTIYKNYRLIWLLVPLMVFWANVHGGYLYAFIMLVPFAGIHLLLRLPRRWTFCLGFIGLWLVLYLMSYKFISNNNYLQVQKMLGQDDSVPILFKDKILIIWIILAAVSVTLTILKNIQPGPFYAYHIGAGIIYFLSLAPRFFLAQTPYNLNPQYKEVYSNFISTSQVSFLFVFFLGGLLILAMALKKERFIALPIKGLYHTIGAGVTAFIAMIVFNPFHLTNLTHTFEISVSKHAESWRQVNEWKPAFDWMDKTTSTPNPVGNEEAFGVLCILMGIALFVWLGAYLMRPRPNPQGQRGRKKRLQGDIPGEFSWPKIDLAMIIIALLTIYMAVRSRRFIAIAGIACPVLALLIQQNWQMISSGIQWKRDGKMKPLPLPPAFQHGIGGGVILVVLVLAIVWGGKYKRIYLDPWPSDDRYNSVFMRMTASHLKPFGVCDFINDNQVSGRVFNYWTEGGAVAFGQTPDPETGHPPLKLFMDGRAQAAYNHDKFKLWQMVFSGGPIAQKAMMRNGKIPPEQMKEVGKWIDKQLSIYDTWVVLMPKTQEDSIMLRALKQTANWKTAYLDNTQHLMVNVESAQGEELIDKILKDEAVFPDAYSNNITLSTAIFENNRRERLNDLYPLTKAAFDEHPDPTSVYAMIRLKALPALRPKITADFQAYVEDFLQQQDAYNKQDGYLYRLAAAEVSARFLSQFHPTEKDKFKKLSKMLRNDSRYLSKGHIW
ncbi:MAG: hypothetical protein ABFR90_01895 [Planctomycetota bacterium]